MRNSSGKGIRRSQHNELDLRLVSADTIVICLLISFSQFQLMDHVTASSAIQTPSAETPLLVISGSVGVITVGEEMEPTVLVGSSNVFTKNCAIQ